VRKQRLKNKCGEKINTIILNISQYYWFRCGFDQINSALTSKRRKKKTFKNPTDPKLLNGPVNIFLQQLVSSQMQS